VARNLLEYLEVVKADPMMTKLAHARIYDLIISARASSIERH
jgi:predicted Ser/Thr protein kinase